MPRIELFNEKVLIDSIPVSNYSREELNELLEEMGQPRNPEMTWEKINAAEKLAEAFATNNFSMYNEILKKEEADALKAQQQAGV